MKRNRGFSLIEIAMVVAIGLVLLSLGLAAINSQLSSASYSITKKRQDAIKDALIGYLGARKAFPCPYVPILGSAVTGIAPPQNVAPPACTQSFGTVPFATLGLAREIGEDGWGNLFSYQLYTDATPISCPGSGKDWGFSPCFGAGKSGGLTVNDRTVVAPILLAGNVVAVVISHGANGLGAWVAALGTRNAPPITCEELQNAVGLTSPSCTTPSTPNIFYKGESQANDDVVAYLTASDVLQPLVKQGAINSAAAQVNIDLENLYEQTIALNISSPACSPVGLPTLGLDPWGNAYQAPPWIDPNLICFYSTGGSGAAPSATCTCNFPTICRPLSKLTLNPYRSRASTALCP